MVFVAYTTILVWGTMAWFLTAKVRDNETGESRSLFSGAKLETSMEYVVRGHGRNVEGVRQFLQDNPSDILPSRLATCVSSIPMILYEEHETRHHVSERRRRSLPFSNYIDAQNLGSKYISYGETIQVRNIRI